jgi:hypothetical protein
MIYLNKVTLDSTELELIDMIANSKFQTNDVPQRYLKVLNELRPRGFAENRKNANLTGLFFYQLLPLFHYLSASTGNFAQYIFLWIEFMIPLRLLIKSADFLWSYASHYWKQPCSMHSACWIFTIIYELVRRKKCLMSKIQSIQTVRSSRNNNQHRTSGPDR